VTPQQIVPAMEGYAGKKISTEGIREAAKTIWDNIQAFLKKIWERIVAFFRVSVIVPQLESRIEAMEKMVKELGKPKEGVKVVKIRHNAFSIDGKMLRTPAELMEGCEVISTVAEHVFTKQPDNIAWLGSELAKLIGDFTPETASETIDKMRGVLAKAHGTEDMKDIPSTRRSDSGDFEIISTGPLLGGGEIQFRQFKKNDDASPLGALDHFRKSGMIYNPSAGSTRADDGVDFPLLPAAGMEKALKGAKALLATIKDFHSKELPKLKKAGDELRAASAKATAAISKINQEDKGQAALVNEYRAILNFNAAYAGWVQQPAIPFYGKIISTVKALMYLVKENMNQYEGDTVQAAMNDAAAAVAKT